jgi:hypothetical protein
VIAGTNLLLNLSIFTMAPKSQTRKLYQDRKWPPLDYRLVISIHFCTLTDYTAIYSRPFSISVNNTSSKGLVQISVVRLGNCNDSMSQRM